MSNDAKRMKGVVAQIPICYGNIAWWQGSKAEPTKTHKWTTFVRGCRNEDLSPLIKKVVINLHHSFDQPKRAITTQPYEVTEYGWGEFEITIKVHFVDPSEKAVELFHLIKLHGPEGSPKKKPVVSEHYDEIVFNEPTESFYNKLKQYELPEGSGIRIAPHPSVSFTNIALNEAHEAERILAAKSKVKQQLQLVREEYEAMDKQVKQLKGTLQQKGALYKF